MTASEKVPPQICEYLSQHKIVSSFKIFISSCAGILCNFGLLNCVIENNGLV